MEVIERSTVHAGGVMLDRIRRAYLPFLPYEACIAGGYAACPERSGDIDVWVYGVPERRLASVRDEILAHLWDSSIVYEEERSERGVDFPDSHAYSNQLTLKVAKVLPIHGQSVHIMVTSLPSPTAILDGFDISTHMVAVDDKGRVIRGQYWTPLNAEPKVIRFTSTTDARMVKIGERYADMRG